MIHWRWLVFHGLGVFVLLRTKRMQLPNHANTQTVKRSQPYRGLCDIQYIYIYIYIHIPYEIQNVGSARVWDSTRILSGGTEQLHTFGLDGTLCRYIGFQRRGKCSKRPYDFLSQSMYLLNLKKARLLAFKYVKANDKNFPKSWEWKQIAVHD